MLVERSPEEMLAVHLGRKDWAAAFQVARAYGQDCDQVYRFVGGVRQAHEQYECD